MTTVSTKISLGFSESRKHKFFFFRDSEVFGASQEITLQTEKRAFKKHVMKRHAPLSFAWAGIPYVGTLLGVWWLDWGLVAVGVYHTGIVVAWLLCRFPVQRVFRGMRWRTCTMLALLCLTTWPLLLFLWPYMARPGVELPDLLQRWGLTGGAVWVFALYSVTLHPVLEEAFWRGMLPDHLLSDALFAGFHLLVLAPLIHVFWLPVVFGVLVVASSIWRHFARETQGLWIPVVTHAIADLGVLLAVVNLVG